MWVKNCIKEHFLSLIGGDSYHNALLMIKGCYPQQRWSDCVCTRTVSIQQSPSLAEVVDKGLEKVQEKNNVGQKLHKSTAFR